MGGSFPLYLQGSKGRKTNNNGAKYRVFDFLTSKITKGLFQKSDLKKEILDYVAEEKKAIRALKDEKNIKKSSKKITDSLVPCKISSSPSSLSPQEDIKFFPKSLSPNLSDMSNNDTDVTVHNQRIFQYMQEDDGFQEFKKNYSQFLKISLKNSACQLLDLTNIYLELNEHFNNLIKNIQVALNTNNTQRKDQITKNLKKVVENLAFIAQYHLESKGEDGFPKWSDIFEKDIKNYLLVTICQKDFFKDCFSLGFSGNLYTNGIQDSLRQYFHTFFLLEKRITLSKIFSEKDTHGISLLQLKDDLKNKNKRIFGSGYYGDFVKENYKMIYGENKHHVLLPNIGCQEKGKKVPFLTMVSAMAPGEIYKHFMADFLIFTQKIQNLFRENHHSLEKFFKTVHIFHGQFMEKFSCYKKANQDVLDSIELEPGFIEDNEKTWIENIRIYENEEFSLNFLNQQGFSLGKFFS